MEYVSVPFSTIDTLPKVDKEKVRELLQQEQRDFCRKILVLDDDPTGTQTVHDVPVVTDWEEETIQKIFEGPDRVTFILTNSRSFSAEKTSCVHREIAERVAHASKRTGKEFLLLSRGDSTLRGHFPLETEILKDTLSSELGTEFQGEIICPFFLEGGRFTIGNVHYVREGEKLVPAGTTEFAADKTFGYRSSQLGEYVEEKTGGKYPADQCIYISIEALREMRLDEITAKLEQAEHFAKIIVNAADYVDLEIFCICWIRAMRSGRHYLARCAASLVRVIGNIDVIPLLSRKVLVDETEKNGGLVIVGSHVKKTTEQLSELEKSGCRTAFLEFQAEACMEEDRRVNEINRVLTESQEAMQKGQTAVVYTSRKLIVPETSDKDKILELSVRISDALTEIVHRLSLRPRFIVAKGGITSSDVATKGLSIRKAKVMGQIKKGIPVWQAGEESKFPGMPYVIFPGNVGEAATLREIVEELEGEGEEEA